MVSMLIDTDCGVDDAEAILMALRHAGTTVEAITTVTGNVHLDLVNRNVAVVQHVAGTNVPMYAGASEPLVESWQHAESYHLRDGLGEWDDRPDVPLRLQPEAAAVALVRLANEHPQSTLVALAPLTNLALAVRLDPTFPSKIGRLVVMGGAVNAVGNTERVATEFNIGADPEAAHIVFTSFPALTLVGWEATLAHPMAWADFDRLCALPTPYAAFFRGMNAKLTAVWRHLSGSTGHLLPDPLAMAVALEPSLILETEQRAVRIELNGTLTRGQTVVNYGRHDYGTVQSLIVKRVDMGGVLKLYENMLS